MPQLSLASAARINTRGEKGRRTIPRSGGAPRGRRRSLMRGSVSGDREGDSEDGPEVLLMRKRALVRLARPSMLSVPMKDVLMVLTALNW